MTTDCLTHPSAVTVHTLLRIGGASRLIGDSALPHWVDESLGRAPWVVVRRAACESLVPVGIRGRSRGQRFAAWVSPADIIDSVTPVALACGRGWRKLSRCAQVPALAALDQVHEIMSKHGLSGAWGPAGSVGFELASGCVTASRDSDLDLVIDSDPLLPAAVARSLQAAFATLSVRSDVLLETPRGAVALGEYARTSESFMLRTVEGPRLVSHRLL